MIVLGLETTCDETAAALVDGERRILAQTVLSQIEDHRPHGGVVPEIAARAHVEHLDGLIARIMTDATVSFADLDAVAACAGPGLIGGVLVGTLSAKAIAQAHAKPYLGINHLEAHALTPRLTDNVAFPYLLLLVSGGHCQILMARGVGQYERLGGTIDDAPGEAFDKVARLLGLPYPGGPAIEDQARAGDPGRFTLPRPMLGREGFDMSFSGLKTAVRHQVDREGPLDPQATADLCAGFQAAVRESLCARLGAALGHVTARGERPTALVAAGGVAANGALRDGLAALAARHHVPFVVPPQTLCTDNAAMVAWAGVERLRLGQSDPLDLKARPRWPLSDLHT